MFAPWQSQNPVRKTLVSGYWKIVHHYTIFYMFENPRRDRQARNFTTNVPKILDLKSSSEQIFSWKVASAIRREDYYLRDLSEISRGRRGVGILGHVHTYPEICFSANIFLRMWKFLRPHAAYSNRFQPSTRIVSGNFLICSSAQFFCRRESWNEHAHNCDLGAISFAP